MTLELTILGCASSGGVPRAGGLGQPGKWGACDPTNPRNRRKRCSLLVERASPDGKTVCVIDTGPDFRQQMLDAEIDRIDAVVYTHEHADHLHGLDDLRPFALSSRALVPVFMDDKTYSRALGAFGYCFETPAGSSYPPILARQRIDHAAPITIEGDGGTITLIPVPVVHGDIVALGFRIEDALYLPDVSEIPAESAHHFAGLETLIIDALRHRPHVSHFNLEQALALRDEVKPRHTVLTNMHIDLDYETVRRETPDAVEPAYDGMVINGTV
ncbi:MAG: MBL fold metallo-hydrolase [Devosiaceae bacterium]|nr:MBL fold metallo-hydrolase [Devosiaceae bacterium MH13]